MLYVPRAGKEARMTGHLVTPIHTGTVAGHPVRFFKGPSGRPELPWHAVEDLYRAIALSHAARQLMLRRTDNELSREFRAVGTPDAIVTIASHPAAQALFDAVAGLPRLQAPAHVGGQYLEAGVEAFNKLTGDLPPAACFAFAAAAFRNTNGGSEA